MNGTYDRATEAVTLTPGSGPLAATLQGGPFGTLPVYLSQQQWAWVGSALPTRGELYVQRSDTDTILVTVDNTLPGVSVTWHDNTETFGPDSFTWAQFEDLVGSGAPEYQQIASFAYSMRGFVFEQAARMIDALEIITSRDAELAAGPVVVSCDPYPPGSATAGTVTYTWNDDTGNGDLGPGDSFTIAYDQCWVNDPADDIDELVNGTASLSGYTEVTDPSLWIGGDMTFSNLVVTETQETSPGVFETLPDPVTVGGGLQIFFWEL